MLPPPLSSSSCSLTILWAVLSFIRESCFAIYRPFPLYCDADRCSALPLAPLQGQSKVSSVLLCFKGPWQWFLPRRSTDRPRPSLYPIFFHFPLVENSDCWKSVATECRKSLCLIAASKLMTATVYLYLCLSVLYYTEKIYWHLKNVLQIIIKQKSISLMYIYCILRWIKFLLSHCILYSWKKHFFPPSIYKRGRRSLPYYVTAPWHLNFLSAWVSVGWQLPQVRSLSPVCSPDITVMQSTPHFAIFPHEERLSQFNCTWI